MLNSLQVLASAKINLSLKVLPRREDGFHDIESLFQMIPFADKLNVRCVNGVRKCTVICDSCKLPEDNTLVVAYKEFAKHTGLEHGLEVVLEKKIPCGAGLGGGSSDAAALIRAMNEMFDFNLPLKECEGIASRVGSDVSFFLSGGTMVSGYNDNAAAIVTGRGEIVHRITSHGGLCYLLICPEVHSSTVEAYKMFDECSDLIINQDFPVLADLEEMYYKPVAEWKFNNSFAKIMANKYPEIGKAVTDLCDCGSLYSQMSGSGSSVFGVFESLEDAKDAYGKLSQMWKRCFILPSS